MKKEKEKENAKFWHATDFKDMELLKARYITHTFPRHIHSGYAIGIIEQGIEIFYNKKEVHAATTGSIVVINPEEVHTGYAGDDKGWKYRMMYPDSALLRDLASEMAGRSLPHPIMNGPLIHDLEMAEKIRYLHSVLESSVSRIKRQEIFAAVMSEFIRRYARNHSEIPIQNDHRAIRLIKNYLNDCYQENISLDQIEDITGLSRFYLTRIFKKSTGLPPHAYLTQIRIERAKSLLCKEMPISHVAAETGFVDQSHLNRHFKKIVGVTPGKFFLP